MKKMKNFKIYMLLILSILHFGVLNAQVESNLEDDYIKGRIRLKLKQEVFNKTSNTIGINIAKGQTNFKEIGLINLDKVSNQIGISKIKRVFPFSPKFEAKHRKYGLHLWYEVQFDSTKTAKEIIKQYTTLGEVDIVKPVYKKTRIDNLKKPVVFEPTSKKINTKNSSVFNYDDPELKDQWHYDNDNRFGDDSSDIDLFEAWNTTSGRSDIIIAIVDQGVDFNHEDLKDNMWVNEAELNGEEGVDDDQNGYIDDFHGTNFNIPGAITPGDHGTHVAGTVGAVGNNGIGVAGVAGGDGSGNGVKLMTTQVFDARSSGGVNFAEAIVYGADNGAVISQNSWGYNLPDYYEPEVLDAIRYFITEAGQYTGSPMKGGILFFATGNDGVDSTRYPGAFDEVIAVSATGPTGLPAPYTNIGDWVDISAPGGDMTNFGEEGGILSTITDNQYGYMEGTSMACPHVSGVAALVLSKIGNENLTPEDLRRIIINSTAPFRFQHNNKYGKGILNAAKALIDDKRIPPNAITDLNASETFHNEIRLAWTVPDDEDGFSPSNYYLAISEEPITAANFENQGLFLVQNNIESGETFNINIGGLIKETNYWFAVKSLDQFENTSEISNVLAVTTSSEPHFMSSTRNIDVTINVNDNPLANVPVTFSNISEGIIYWESLISNEISSKSQNKSTLSIPKIIYQSTATSSSTIGDNNDLGTPFEPVRSISTAELSQSSISSNEHWENDATEFIAGLSYENGTPPAFLAGTGNSNAGLIFGTRFDVPYDYSFNLTHIEVGLLPETNEYPITVEIRKGSRNDMTQAETVYMQEYYPDAVNELKYYRIPIYKPQKFQDNESFWVVLHFPNEMLRPLLLQVGGSEYIDRFIFSRDNGRTYEEAVNLMLRSVIPMLRAFSTGDDGSYVFLDPKNGEIQEKSDQNVEITIDANHLTNGNHLASIGLVTNDIHKPVVNIELKLKVEGQVPVVDNSVLNEYDVFANEDNNLELDVKNTGLADFEVYGYTVRDADNTEVYSDTLVVKPSGLGKVPFIYSATTEGVINDKILLNTNIGELPFSLRVISEKGPSMALSLSSTNVNVNYGDEEPVTLTISNDGTGAALEYDIKHYSIVNKEAGLLNKKLNYSISSSLDIGGPTANKWEDISEFGTTVTKENLLGYDFSTGMKFPYFNQQLEFLNIDLLGDVQIFNYRAMTPLIIEGEPLNVKEITYHSFGNRVVFTFYCDIMKLGSKGYGPYGETVTYQVVFFKDGTIEYRYKDVSDLTSDKDFKIFMQGLEASDSYVYRDYGDSLQISNGLVVRFTPDSSVSMISEASKLDGVILSGNSEDISLSLDPKSFNYTEGTYNDTLVVYNNTAAKFSTIPLTINVLGSSDISVKDSLNYKDPVFIGQSKIQYLRIDNKGAKAINLVSASVNLSQFTIDNSLFPLEVKGVSNIMLPVSFTPTTANELQGEISVNFQDGTVYKAIVTAEGLEDSKYTHDLTLPISVNVTGGEKTSIPFNITNTGNSAGLEYVFKNSKFIAVSNDAIGKAIGENSKEVITDYGYTWELSDSLKIFHKWDALNLEEGRLEIAANEYKSIELPFDFPFYGENYNTIWISPNGYIAVKEPNKQPQSPGFYTDDEFYGVIAPLWATLKLNDNGNGLNYKVQDNKLIVQWYELKGQNSSSDPGTVSFQVEINAEGVIKFHYDKIDTWGGLVKYGIKSPDGTEFLEEPRSIIMNWASIKDDSSILIAPPQHGKIDTQQQDAFNLTVSAENIYFSGKYQDTLILVSNSKNQKTLEIPVELNVTGAPVLFATDSLNWNDIIFKDNLTLRKAIHLTNKGYDVLKVATIASDGLENLNLYDEAGNRIIRNSSGVLLSSLDVNPWETFTMYAEISVSEHKNQNGKIYFSGNFPNKEIVVSAVIVDSPIFSWDAQDQEYSLTNVEKEEYTFNVENKGDTSLSYTLIPATVPYVDPTPGQVHISDKIGEYEFEDRVIVDSLAIDTKHIGDGVFTPWTSGANLAFSNRFTAPAGGFNLTHIKSYSYFDKIDEIITIMIYKSGGDLPQDGEKLYEQQFVINSNVNEEWIYFPLEKPFFIPEGEDFFIIMTHPVSNKYLGFDNSNDIDVLQHCFTGVYQGNNSYYWYPGHTQSEYMVWKVRPLTASGKNQWLTLDTKEGVIPAGSTVAVKATINPEIAGKGTHIGKIIAKSNDINNPKDDVTITLNVNGAPELKFYPNIYKDSLNIIETEHKVFNYLFEDPEGEDISISMDETIEGIEYELTQTGQNTAQISVNTDYESEGSYRIPVELKDAVGNITVDTLAIKVLEKNRAPVFNTKYEVITLNLAATNKAVTIDPFDMFSDPDSDGIQILAGNYNPEIVDMALGSSFINLNPLKVGTGQLVFGADDGKENGFVIHLVYVNVIDDTEAVGTSAFGLLDEVNLDESELPAIFTPNPVVDGFAKLYYKLDAITNMSIKIYSSNGQLFHSERDANVSVGEHVKRISFEKMPPGLYICLLNAEGKASKSFKVIVK
jgi:subtilisin family serine protease